jgi:hypothetical protein
VFTAIRACIGTAGANLSAGRIPDDENRLRRQDGPVRMSVLERRTRLALRHRLAPGAGGRDAVETAASLVCLHATDPSTVYLSLRARVDGLVVEDVGRALYDERSLVKHLAMRRTLWGFTRDLLPAGQAGASDRVAAGERRRLIRDVERFGVRDDGTLWLADACAQVLSALEGGREATQAELRSELPILDGAITYGEGKSWGGQFPVAPRVLTVLSAEGRIVRATNAGGWTTSRPRWTRMEDWLGEVLSPPAEAEGRARLVEAWLRAFGPGTQADLRWWLGSTLTGVRAALADVGAVEVDLDGATGYVLPDDRDAHEPVEPWAALLPSLDPTTMGWSERDWYLGPYKAQVFDVNGNAGPTAWWDGRIVGGWRKSRGGDVELQLLEDVGADAREALEREAERLGEWIGAATVLPRFPSPLSKA